MRPDYDPYSHRHQQDPYPQYRALREHAPVHYAEASDTWVISRYADVQQVLKRADVFSSRTDRRRQGFEPSGPLNRVIDLLRFTIGLRATPWSLGKARILIQEGGQQHADMRKLVNMGFTPRRIQLLEKRVRELAGEGLRRAREAGRFDFVEEVAIPLPVTVISEMLGIEPERRHDFKRWSDAIIQGSTGSGIGTSGRGVTFDALCEMRQYLRPIVQARRESPAQDLISILTQAEGRGALNDLEIFLFVLLLLIAGNETTTNLLGNTVDALLDHPDELARVVQDPDRVPGLVEESLRFDSPVQYLTREALAPCEIAGTTIPAKAHVVVLLASANRDERVFEDPDRFDVTRDLRGHLGFGFGAHFCLGASLARLEAKAMLEALVPELPGLVRSRPEREFLDSYLIRGRKRLELEPADGAARG